MTDVSHDAGSFLVPVVALLLAAVVAVPLFKRMGLGSVLGYLAAGLIMGPSGISLLSDPQSLMHVAELGVMMFLFTIGLEMRPARLWAMRGDIFGLGLVQVGAATLALTGMGMLAGLSPEVAFVIGAGFVLTSTAIVVQMLDERRQLATDAGRRIVAILLLEDLSIVPLLAAIAFMAPAADASWSERLFAASISLAAIGGLIAAGRWILNPMFRLLAGVRSREIMTAASLLVVVGSAWVMQLGGLSMALGTFLAGVLLSGSVFRHQLEADVAPFRGILLGLFFVSVGMTLDLAVITAEWRVICAGVVAYVTLKGLVIYATARLFRTTNVEALRRTALMAQGGEFAFVLYSTALTAGVLDASTASIATSIIVISMLMTPAFIAVAERIVVRAPASMKGAEPAKDLDGDVLLVGFGRFGHIASQPLLDAGYSISIIDTDPQMIRDAADFGFKVYFGDGARLDILEAAGAAKARAILVCVDGEDTALKITEIARASFRDVPLLARAKHREHAFDLINAGVTWQIRDTLESAFVFGERVLTVLGHEPEAITDTMQRVRRDDAERFEIQRVQGLYAGLSLIRGNVEPPADNTQRDAAP